MFYVGQKVVCINVDGHYGSWVHDDGNLDGLTKGTIYTIRRAGPYRGEPSVWLEEIVREAYPKRFGEAGFAAQRFRPVVEPDITVFQKMLTPKRDTVGAD